MGYTFTSRGWQVPDEDEKATVPKHLRMLGSDIDRDMGAGLRRLGQDINTETRKRTQALSSLSGQLEGLRQSLRDVGDAYGVAVAAGFEGSREEWLESLRGPAGAPGGATVTDPEIASLIDGDTATAQALQERFATAQAAAEALSVAREPVPSATVRFTRDEVTGVDYELIHVRSGKPVPRVVSKAFGKGRTGKLAPASPLAAEHAKITEHYDLRGAPVIFNEAGFTTAGAVWGCQIQDGVLLRDFTTGERGSLCLGFRADGTARIYDSTEGWTGAKLLADGVVDTFGFTCPLVIDGSPVDVEATGRWPSFSFISARQVLGVNDLGEVMILTSHGKSSASGIGLNDTARLAHAEGMVQAIMLDGGGSAQTAVNGHITHPSSDVGGNRAVPCVGLVHCTVGKADTGWRTDLIPLGTRFTAGTTRPFHARWRDGQVLLRGVLESTEAAPAGAWTKLFDVPARLLPDGDVSGLTFQVTGPAGKRAAASITGSQFLINPASAMSWFDLSSVWWSTP